MEGCGVSDHTRFCTSDGEINTVCEASWWVRNASLYGLEEWAAKVVPLLEVLTESDEEAHDKIDVLLAKL